MPSDPRHVTPDLRTLAGLFYSSLDELGRFVDAPVQNMPISYQYLLAHTSHMTVAVEEFHRSTVDVHVLAKVVTPSHYARKIMLSRASDGAMVQFGIMRVNFAYLSPVVRDEIVSEHIPLGRVLISHDVHRRVRLAGLWEVTPGPDLQKLFGLDGPRVTYGRTALIECNAEPAIELVEIVAPMEEKV